MYLRPGNLTPEERKEAFAEFDPDFDPARVKPLEPVTAHDGFTMLCVRIVQNIVVVMLDAYGERGEACMRAAVREFAADFAGYLKARAAARGRSFDRAFAVANTPLDFAPDGPGAAIWACYSDPRPRKLFEEEFYSAFGIPFGA